MNLKIMKEGTAEAGQLPEEELAAINAFAKTALTADQVYTFSVILCDNEVDRDGECFPQSTLMELRDLFVGKTGICDHDWKSSNQKARIYRTELITDPTRTSICGEPYTYLKAYAYMLRTESNRELIAEIEGGIKKETSVGCSVARITCSICGAELGTCGHIKGECYDDKLCYGQLEGAVDAYEWSFVAVPAQRGAGVTKQLGSAGGLKGFVATSQGSVFAGEYAALAKCAALGKQYLDELKAEVLRLCLVCDEGMYPVVKGMVEMMEAEQLQGMKAHYQELSAKKFPALTQLPGKNETVKFDGEAFRI